MRRHRSASRILAALVECRFESPGATVSPRALMQRGWPTEELDEPVARNRLHVALHTLRKLGLEPLERTDGAYRLSPDVPARRRPADRS